MQILFTGLTSRRGAAARIPPPITLMYTSLYLKVVQTKSTVMKIVAINSIHKSSRRHHKGALFCLVEFKTNI